MLLTVQLVFCAVFGLYLSHWCNFKSSSSRRKEALLATWTHSASSMQDQLKILFLESNSYGETISFSTFLLSFHAWLAWTHLLITLICDGPFLYSYISRQITGFQRAPQTSAPSQRKVSPTPCHPLSPDNRWSCSRGNCFTSVCPKQKGAAVMSVQPQRSWHSTDEPEVKNSEISPPDFCGTAAPWRLREGKKKTPVAEPSVSHLPRSLDPTSSGF